MRLAAQMRGGFYPASEKAVAQAAQYLSPPRSEPFSVLDPCAGEGAAIRQLSALLGCSPAGTYAIELDEGRAAMLHQALPEAHVLAPANFFGCQASAGSFSFIWLNPPFDQGYGGRRVEEQFLKTATHWLLPGGVIAFVCPENVMDEYSDACSHLAIYYEQCTTVPFPKDHRPFNEVVVLAQKRIRPRIAEGPPRSSWAAMQAPHGFIYPIPSGTGPRTFQKVEPTEPELKRLLANSPLQAHLAAPPAVRVPSPPLTLGIGHVALLLASGHLDGMVQQAGESPHVVRGTARKKEYVADVSETTNADGSVSTRTTISERIDLVVRTVDLTGAITTFIDTDAAEAPVNSS